MVYFFEKIIFFNYLAQIFNKLLIDYMEKPTLLIILLTFFFNCLSQEQNTTNNSEIIDSLNNKAYIFYKAEKYDSAEYYYIETLKLQEADENTDEELIASTYANLGVIYRQKNNYKKALEHLSIAEKYFVVNNPTSPYLGYVFNTKANIFFDYSDYSEAELYYKYCLDFFEKNQRTNSYQYGQVYINIGNILVEQNRNKEAIKFLSNFKVVGDFDQIFDMYEQMFNKHLYLAEAHQKEGEYSKALLHTDTAKYLLDKYLEKRYKFLNTYNYVLASIYSELGDYSKALKLLEDNIAKIEARDSNDTIHFEKLSETYLLKGNILYLKEDYKECIKYLSRILNSIEFSIDKNKDPAQNILNEQSFNRTIIDFHRLHGNAALKLYFQSNNIDYLKESLDNLSKSIEYLMVFRLHMRNEESVFIESNTSLSLIHEAIAVAARLYNITKDDKYLYKAFLYSENMKAFSLYSEIKSGEAISFSDLPNNLKNLEDSLNNELNHISELIYKEKIKENPREKIIADYNQSYLKIKNRYNTLLDSLENNFPNYFNLKYSQDFITPNEIMDKLSHDECLVEYVLSDSILTTFVIDKENIQVLNKQVDSTFSQLCFDYFSLLQNQDFSNNVRETYENYTNLAYKFYDILVAPVLELTDSREITFVPDGAIMYLPFESFVTSEDFDKTRPNYRDLPYLIYDVSVGYSYSSTLLFSERIRTKPPNKKVLAFAPEYKNLLDEELQSIWNRQSERDFLMPLPGAKEEVLNIANTVATDVYLDTAASEENFKALASDYSVLHLAMHTIMDDESPMNSRLAFTRNFNDSTEDHNLYTYEIYNLPLNADMVVLSSCSSGYGQMQKGEGMMSMARGFIYAGCPSIVMTLWQVSDLSSAELMTGFYKYLKKGYSKKKALHQAKIDYIQSSDNLKANPYFWSAFLMVGDNTPLYATSGTTYLVIILVVFTLIIIGVIYRKQIRIAIQRKK